MNEQQVRNIIREELASFMKQSKYVFDRPVQILDGNDIMLGRTHGTRIGTSDDQLLGFFGHQPVAQQPHVTDPSGGTVIDGPARTAIGQLLGNLEQLGLFETV